MKEKRFAFELVKNYIVLPKEETIKHETRLWKEIKKLKIRREKTSKTDDRLWRNRSFLFVTQFTQKFACALYFFLISKKKKNVYIHLE